MQISDGNMKNRSIYSQYHPLSICAHHLPPKFFGILASANNKTSRNNSIDFNLNFRNGCHSVEFISVQTNGTKWHIISAQSHHWQSHCFGMFLFCVCEECMTVTHISLSHKIWNLPSTSSRNCSHLEVFVYFILSDWNWLMIWLFHSVNFASLALTVTQQQHRRRFSFDCFAANQNLIS